MKTKFAVAISCLLATTVLAQNKTHDLTLKPENIQWGYYDGNAKPVLRVAPGDTVRVETMVARGTERLKAAGVRDDEIPPSFKAIEAAVTVRGPGAHPLTGPIYVEGAAPGDTVAVKIINIEFLHPYGVSYFVPGSGALPDEFPYSYFKLIRFDPKTGDINFGSGVSLKLAPFFGSIGVAMPGVLGKINSGPPGPHTGNLDNKALGVGSTLYMPVHVPGALVSLGDGHGIQGDGEVTITALETSLRGTIQISLLKGKHLIWPRAETPTHYITMGLHTDLDEAAKLATHEMIDFLVSEKHLSRDDAYILCSLAADLHVTQVVDGTKGVHAMISKSIFK